MKQSTVSPSCGAWRVAECCDAASMRAAQASRQDNFKKLSWLLLMYSVSSWMGISGRRRVWLPQAGRMTSTDMIDQVGIAFASMDSHCKQITHLLTGRLQAEFADLYTAPQHAVAYVCCHTHLWR